MGLRIQTSKKTLSNWMMIVFVFTLAFSAGISEFFQAPKSINQDLQQYHFLFSKHQIANFNEIRIDNRLGKFSLSRKSDSNKSDSHWDLISPRVLPASMDLVNRLLLTLEGVKIRKLYPKDPINMSNFSLDNPLMKISLHTREGSEEEIHFGLVNPIDNSTYIYSRSKEVIYHVDALANSLEGLGLSEFVDSKVFTMDTADIVEFKLFRRLSSLQLTLTKKEDNWIGKSGKTLMPNKVNEYLNSLLNIKSALILDKLTENLEKTLKRLQATPFYFIKLKLRSGEEISYNISTIVSNLPDIKLDKGQIYIIKASNREYPYVLTRDSFKFFGKKHKSFKKLPFKKLFY
ncbi:MAG: DUF4340 domain-containing protein [Bacteriovoracaceae bacterium]|nr:DUF4340 domain-containing protein [Bacteriovoracaceae bacterium]